MGFEPPETAMGKFIGALFGDNYYRPWFWGVDFVLYCSIY